MYLSEKRRAKVRKCIENCRSESKDKHTEKVKKHFDSLDSRKVSQILFDARDGKEVFTPF